MLLVGCKPTGRNTEQHDVFFGIADTLKELVPAINKFWPAVANKFHLDGWREVNHVDGYKVTVVPHDADIKDSEAKLFFLNLGGYKPGEFEEFHYKMIVAAPDKAGAIKASKKTAFYLHTGYKSAPSHIDDKYGIDVDDSYEIKDVLASSFNERYSIHLQKASGDFKEDKIELGYFKISSLK
ncbi:MAG: DUF1543 domain-containing protein [Chitinophagaceae bacterium]|nr:MAG: DUF1543 domain-containing protein [Chitinophagaceae bacterium]